MKKKVLILTACLLFWGCKEDENIDTLNGKARVMNIGWASCDYILAFDGNLFLYPDSLPENVKQHELRVNVTYKTTGREQHCGFGGLLDIIEVVEVSEE